MDFKKDEKQFYQPKTDPVIVEIPEMQFIMVDGAGDPNQPDGEYASALALLYGLSYTVKMAPKNGVNPAGYLDYVVPPLEGLWWMKDGKEPDFIDKARFEWIAMIRQPEFVTQELFGWACEQVARKKNWTPPRRASRNFTKGCACSACISGVMMTSRRRLESCTRSSRRMA